MADYIIIANHNQFLKSLLALHMYKSVNVIPLFRHSPAIMIVDLLA